MTSHKNQADFQRLTEPYRAELQVHCYRMLGSFHEAEDLVQETLVRAWQGFHRFEERGTLRGWLYRIATNACLTALNRRPRRILPETEGQPNPLFPADAPLTERAWLEPYPDTALERIADTAPGPHARYEMHESLELAFVAAIQYLPARQRAILLLCDVLGWSALEAANLLDSTVVSVRSTLQRARTTLGKHQVIGQKKTSALPDDQQRALVSRYIRAWEHTDLDSFTALLREDALLSMPPWPQWYRGREAIATFFYRAWALPRYESFHVIPIGANLQPACAIYSRSPGSHDYAAHSIQVFTLKEDTISVLTAFIEPGLFTTFHLPPVLALVNEP